MHIKKDLTIALESLTICGGECKGCFLTPEMRTNSNFWNEEQFEKIGDFVRKTISYHSKDSPIEDIGVNFGQGDYLQLSESKIIHLVDSVSSWTKNKSSVFFTTSAVTNRTKLLNNINIFNNLSLKHKIPLIFDVVLNATKINSKFSTIYEENLKNITQCFGYFNLHINMGLDVVENISPFYLKELLIKNNIRFIAINFLITNHTNNSKKSILKIIDWLYKFMETSIGAPYKINYLENIQRLIKSYSNDEISYKDYLADCIKNYKRNLFIDYYGNLFVIQDGFGDNPLTTRNNYEPICNIFEIESIDIEKIMHEIELYAKKITHKFFLEFNKSNSCSICYHQKTCMNVGWSSYHKDLIYNNDTFCSIEYQKFFNFISSKYQFQDFRNEGVFIVKQKNLHDSLVQGNQYDFDYSNNFKLLNNKN